MDFNVFGQMVNTKVVILRNSTYRKQLKKVFDSVKNGGKPVEYTLIFNELGELQRQDAIKYQKELAS